MRRLPFIPSPAIKGKYRVVNTDIPTIRFGSLVDLRTITLEEAQDLCGRGFGYLQEIKARK